MVLVAEDDADIAFIVSYMLEREKYTVQVARDGREVERALGGAPPALAILDIMMPFVDGLELLRKMRALPAWSKVPVIMLTAKSQEADIVRALDAGANDYVVKPFQPDELLARVRTLLRTSS
jgi:DNA-binding response OmpR family regulator